MRVINLRDVAKQCLSLRGGERNGDGVSRPFSIPSALSINRQGTAVKLVGAQPSLPRTATTTRDRVAKLFRSPLGSGACGNITTGWGAGVVDVLTYLLFAVVMVVCIWFIDRTLKDDGD